MSPRKPLAVLALAALVVATGGGLPAVADHTDPNEPLAPVQNLGPEAQTFGEGAWEHVANFGGTTGTDLKFFHRGGAVYVSGGQLGQGTPGVVNGVEAPGIVGQRIVQLTDPDGTPNPRHVADHGSAYCGDITNIRSTTGIQHDTAVTPRAYGSDFYATGPKPDAELIIDAVDALGRCHDGLGGGLELIDVSGLGSNEFEPREVHLTRHTGFSHTVTVDATRPWIVYNSTSDFGVDPTTDENPYGIGAAWIDVLDIRTCLGHTGKTLDQKRELCRPKVYRLPFEYAWASAETADGERRQPSACHDITARPGRIYCAAPTATLVFDVSGLTDAQGPAVPTPTDPAGDIKGTPLPCTVENAAGSAGGVTSGAKVTACVFEDPLANPADQTPAAVRQVSAYEKLGRPAATGWKYLGHINHPGRECNTPGNYTCNNNLQTPSTEGVAIAHEADPTPDNRWLLVTDERGGGIVPPGAMCAEGIDNPYGNGGLHVFDLSKKDANGRYEYALNADGERAVFVSENVLLSPTFCTIHVIEQIPDEQRIIAAWYSQGVKVLDYEIGEDGSWTFTEVAGYALLPNDIWAGEVFRIQDNDDGTRTYWLASNDVVRGLDVFTWTGPTNKIATPGTDPAPTPPAPPRPRPKDPLPSTGADYGVLLAAAVLLPAALLLRRRRAAA